MCVPQLRDTGKRVGGIRLRTVKKPAAFIIIPVPAYLQYIIYANKCAGAERENSSAILKRIIYILYYHCVYG